MNIRTSKKAGFTLVEIMIVVAIIGLLAAIAIPNFVRARAQSQTNGCINNLRQIDGAKQQYILENGSAPAAIADIQSYLGRGTAGQLPECPQDPAASAGADYALGATADDPPTCVINAADHVLP